MMSVASPEWVRHSVSSAQAHSLIRAAAHHNVNLDHCHDYDADSSCYEDHYRSSCRRCCSSCSYYQCYLLLFCCSYSAVAAAVLALSCKGFGAPRPVGQVPVPSPSDDQSKCHKDGVLAKI